MSKPPTFAKQSSPYGDYSPADQVPEAPWRGASLTLLVLALALFLGAGVTATAVTIRIVLTVNQNTGADIAVGLMLVVFIAFVLSACGLLHLAHRVRRG